MFGTNRGTLQKTYWTRMKSLICMLNKGYLMYHDFLLFCKQCLWMTSGGDCHFRAVEPVSDSVWLRADAGGGTLSTRHYFAPTPSLLGPILNLWHLLHSCALDLLSPNSVIWPYFAPYASFLPWIALHPTIHLRCQKVHSPGLKTALSSSRDRGLATNEN